MNPSCSRCSAAQRFNTSSSASPLATLTVAAARSDAALHGEPIGPVSACEPFWIVDLEAMARGTAVVASAVGGFPELVVTSRAPCSDADVG